MNQTAATLRTLADTDRIVQGLLIELLAPDWMRRQAADAFEIVRGGMEQMVDLDTRDRALAEKLCEAHEALVARKERAARQGGSQTATEAVAAHK